MMAIRQATLDEIREFIKQSCPRRIDEVVLHHTWSPTAAQYRGASTWEGIRRYHMQTRGWSDIGYHFGVGPDGSYWLLRDYRKSGAHVLNRNRHTIGVAMVGNFDVEGPMANGLSEAASLVRIICTRFDLYVSDIRFHREFASKTCPGLRINLPDFRKMAFPAGGDAGAVDTEPSVPSLAVVLGGNYVDCAPRLVGGRLTVFMGRFSDALDKTFVLKWDAYEQPFYHADTGRMFIHEAAPWFEQQGWVIDGRVWRQETLPGGMRVHRLYPKRVEWMREDEGGAS